MHIRYALRFLHRRRRATYAAADRDVHAGGLSLERTQHEVVAAQHINSKPVHIVERVVQQRNEVCCIGKCVRFVAEQSIHLGIE